MKNKAIGEKEIRAIEKTMKERRVANLPQISVLAKLTGHA